MFEFQAKTSIHAIPLLQQIIYYAVLAALYLLFFRVKRLDILTIAIVMIFIQGFFLAFGRNGFMLFKVLMTIVTMLLLGQTGHLPRTRDNLIGISWFALFTISYILSWHFGVGQYKAMITQYYKYFVPFALFLGISKSASFQQNPDYYARLILRLIGFQIVFTLVKLVVIGFRENIIGSVATTGGAVSVTYALMGAVLYWKYKGETLQGKDWYFYFGLLLIPIGSNKRAIWLMFPLLTGMLLMRSVTKRSLQTISTVIVLLPLLLYFGFRFNPSFNPERKFWGSFDPGFAINWMVNYSTGAHRTKSTLGYGRIGTAEVIIDNVLQDPWNENNLLGYGTRLDEDDIDPRSIGIAGGTVAGFAKDIIIYGWPSTILFFIWSLSLLAGIKDRHNKTVMILLLVWNYLFYTGGFLRSPANSFIFFLALAYIKQKSLMVRVADHAEVRTSYSPVFPSTPRMQGQEVKIAK